MLTTLGRGLHSAAHKTTPQIIPGFFKLTKELPINTLFSRNSTATTLNKDGALIQVGINQPRFAHDENGTALGLKIEPAATNLCVGNNVNPTDMTGFNTSGTGILSLVDDSTELAAAKLHLICTSGQVFKAQATSDSAFTVSIPGAASSGSPKSISLYARGEGITNQTASISLGGATLSIAPAGEPYKRYCHENLTPASNAQTFTITVEGNETLYFILYQMDNIGHCTSVIPVNGTPVTRPTDRAHMVNIHRQDWFNNDQGFLICRYRHERLVDADSYVAVINSGGAGNTIGLRIAQSNKSLQGYIRGGNINQFSTVNNDTQITDILHSAGTRWNSNEAELISGGLRTSVLPNTMPINLNKLEIGARNRGIAPMNGYIESVYVGTQDITSQQLATLIQRPQDFAVACGGQSLMRGHFISQQSNSDGGKTAMRRTINQAQKNSATTFLNGATGGSAANKTSDPLSYWWDLDTNTRGPAFDVFYNRINDSRARITHILWAQGEEDSFQIDTNTTRSQYKQALEAIFADMRQTLGVPPIYIQRIGRRHSFSNGGGIQIVRDIQAELITEHSWCFDAAEIYDLALRDNVHIDDDGYITAGIRNGLTLMNTPGKRGPVISNIIRNDVTLSVTIEHDIGNDFIPTVHIDGFRFFDDNNEIIITNAVKTNANTISLTLSTLPHSANKILYYAYDAMIGLNTANLLKDNSSYAMPLRSAKITVN